MSFNVIVLTYRPGASIFKLLDSFERQTIKPNKIVIVDTISDDKTVDTIKKHSVIVEKIEKSDFNHGTTRDYFARKYASEYLIFMTQDALPYNDYLFEKLLTWFRKDREISIVYARQIAKDNANYQEKLTRSYNYPNVSLIKTKNDEGKYGIKTYFCSNVCAAYRNSDYIDVNGFEHNLKTNEDMFIAAELINKGKKIVYDSNAVVFHSHNHTFKEEFLRSYEQGYEIEKHKDILNSVSANKEGKQLMKFVCENLAKDYHYISIAKFILSSINKYFAYQKGRNAFNIEKT